MKLLLMSYECSPYRGSEWAVGWGRLLGAAKIAETHVITSAANHEALRRALGEGLVPDNVHIHAPAYDDKMRALDRKPVMFAYNYGAYRYWQTLALNYARNLHAREHFNLIHQVNVCTFREPGFTWQLDAPFLWGPMGGSQNFPPRFLSILPAKEVVKEGLRGLSNWVALRKPRVGRAARAAHLILAANSTNQRDFETVFGRPVEQLLETGLHEVTEPDRTRFHQRVADHSRGCVARPLRILWSGELQTRKALPVLLRALRRLGPGIPWRLDVLGDGAMREAWTAETLRLGLSDKVHFLGRRLFAEAVATMHSADLFCFTSLRDTSGNVVLEALAAGVPVVCFDHQGAGDMVTPECGVKLPVTTPKQAYADWARTIQQLAEAPERLLQLSEGATVRARDFLWSSNHDRVNAIYGEIVRCEPSMAERCYATGRERREIVSTGQVIAQ